MHKETALKSRSTTDGPTRRACVSARKPRTEAEKRLSYSRPTHPVRGIRTGHDPQLSGLRTQEGRTVGRDEEQMNESEDESVRGGVNETIDRRKEAEAESTFRNVRALSVSVERLCAWLDAHRGRGRLTTMRKRVYVRTRKQNKDPFLQPSAATMWQRSEEHHSSVKARV
ncbi:hypothetical protein MHYP_G00206750 [Metynnis hypsauchen]